MFPAPGGNIGRIAGATGLGRHRCSGQCKSSRRPALGIAAIRIGDREQLVDLAGFDIPTFVGLIRGAPESLGIAADEVKQVHISIEPNGDMTAPPGSIEISVYVTREFGNSGYIEFNGDATVKRINYPSS